MLVATCATQIINFYKEEFPKRGNENDQQNNRPGQSNGDPPNPRPDIPGR